MGGEPLLMKNYTAIYKILQQANKNGYSYNLITNGVNLDKFVDLFIKYPCETIQITVDGSKPIHDSRRMFKGGSGSFDLIMQNVKIAIKNDIKITLRVNLDDQNVHDLVKLAQYIQNEFICLDNLHIYAYPIQDGGCLGQKNIISEEELIDKVLQQKKKHAELCIFDFYFHGHELLNSIFNNKNYLVKIKNCAAFANQYIFDYSGNIYKCWFGVGNNNFKIGSYISDFTLNEKIDKMWKSRNIKTLKKCTDCKYRFICGGECLSHIYETSDDINKERCVDFYKIIDSQLLQYKEFYA
jgi:uncharacterized protein